MGHEGCAALVCRSQPAWAAAAITLPIYGSGGFTNIHGKQLREQLAGWIERDGCRFAKIKIGSNPERDPQRISEAKAAIGAQRALCRCQWRILG